MNKDKFQSLKLGPNTQVTLFKGEDFGGFERTWTYSDSYISEDGFLKSAESLKVGKKVTKPKTNCIRLWTKTNYKGSTAEFCKDSPNLGEWANKFQSMKFGSGSFHVTFYSGANYKGDRFSTRETVMADFASPQMNKRIVSLKIKIASKPKKGCLWLHQSCHGRGKWFYEVCDNDVKELPSYVRNNVRSIYCGEKTFFTMYENANFEGRSRVLYHGWHSCLTSYSFQGKVRSLEINPNLPTVGDNCVRLYSGYKFNEHGWSEEVCEDTKKLQRKNGYHSIKVGKNVEVTLFDRENFQGDYVNIFESDMWLNQRRFAGRVESVKLKKKQTEVPKGCIRMFQLDNFNGYFFDACKDVPQFPGVTDNYWRSIKVGEGARVMLYQNKNYGGRWIDVSETDSSFSNEGFNNQISSIKFGVHQDKYGEVKKGCVRLYEKCEYKGASVMYCKDTEYFARNMDNKFQGIKLGPETGVILYDYERYRGQHRRMENNDNCLKDGESWGGRTTSLKLYTPTDPKDGCVKTYWHTGFKGPVDIVCTSKASLSNSAGKISSIIVGKHARVRLYRSTSYRNDYKQFETGKDEIKKVTSLKDIGWDDKTYSIRLYTRKSDTSAIPSHCVHFYEEVNWEGDRVRYCSWNGAYNFGGWKNRFSSYKLGTGIQATLYEKYNFKGGEYRLMPQGDKHLDSNDKYNNGHTINDNHGGVRLYKKATEPVQQGCVVFYEDYNYKGYWKQWCNRQQNSFGTYDEQKWSSFKLGDATKVRLCTSNSMRGDCKEWTTSQSGLGSFENKGRSMKVEKWGAKKGCIRLFDNCDYGGSSWEYCGSNNYVHRHRFSSAMLGPQTTYTLYRMSNYQGGQLVIKENVKCFKDHDFDNVISSVKLGAQEPTAKKGCVIFYEKPSFKGFSKRYCGDSNKIDSKLYGKVSSMVLGPNTYITLYGEENFGGEGYYHSKTDSLMTRSEMGDSVKSFKFGEHAAKEGCIRLFRSNNFYGGSQLFCEDTPKLPNVRFYSAKVYGKQKWTLYNSNDYKGEFYQIDDEDRNFHDNRVRYSLRSLRKNWKPTELTKQGCIRFWTECGFTGEYQEYCSNSANVNYKYRNKFKGVQLGPKTTVTVYDKVNYGGDFYVFEKDDNCLSAGEFSKRIDSFRIGNWKPVGENCVRVYEERYYKGSYRDFCGSFPNLDEMGWGSRIQSIMTGKGARVRLYQQVDFKGSRNERGGSSNIQYWSLHDWNKKIKSLVVYSNKVPEEKAKKGCYRLFADCGWRGESVEYCDDVHDLGNWKNKFRSILRGRNAQMRLHDKINYEGGNRYYAHSDACMSEGDMGKKAESIKFFGTGPATGCVRLYKDCNYKGAYKDYCQDKEEISEVFQDKFSSARLGPSTMVTVYDKENFKGDSMLIRYTDSCFTDNQFDNKISSLKIGEFKETIPDDCVKMYWERHFRGTSKLYCKSMPNLGSMARKFRSLRIGKNVQVTLFRNVDYSGSSRMWNSDDSIISEGGFELNQKSLKLEQKVLKPKENCIRLWTKVNYQGETVEYCADNKDLGNYKNRFKSIMVGPGKFYVTLYSGLNFDGQAVSFRGKRPDITDAGMQNRVASLKFTLRNKPRQGCVWLFHACLGSQYNAMWDKGSWFYVACKDYPKLPSFLVRHVSGVMLGSKTSVSLYSGYDFGGKMVYKTSGDNCLVNDGMSDKVLSIKLNEKLRSVKDDCVRLFEGTGYHGWTEELCTDTKKLQRTNKYRSMMIGKNVEVTLYDDDNYGGKSAGFDRSDSDLSDNYFGYRINSLKIAKKLAAVKEGCVRLYQKQDYKGYFFDYCDDVKDFKGLADNQFESIKVGPNTIVRLWNKKNYDGKFVIHQKDDSSFYNEGFANIAGSLKFGKWVDPEGEVKAGCVRLFEKCNYKGKSVTYCNDVKELASNEKNKYSSIKLGEGTGIKMYGINKYRGTKRILENSDSCLSGENFDNRMNSLKLFSITEPKRGCVKAYQYCGFKGIVKTYCDKKGTLGFLNDRISSLRIGPKTKVKLYQHVLYLGKDKSIISKTSTMKEVSCLKTYSFDNKASSLKVYKYDPPVVLKPDCALFYRKSNYKGDVVEVCNDKPVLKKENRYLSVKIGKNVEVTIYDESHYKGNYISFETNDKNTEDNFFKKKVKSVKITPKSVLQPGCVRLYQLAKYKGYFHDYCENVADFKGFADNKYSSIKVAPDTIVRLYNKKNYGGKFVIFQKNDDNFGNEGFNNMAGSLKFGSWVDPKGPVKKGCVRLYEDCQYKGRSVTYCKNIREFAANEKNRYSSVRLGEGTGVSMFSINKYKGKKRRLENDDSCLSGEGMNNRMNSLKVYEIKKPARGCVKAYQYCGYKGVVRTYCKKKGTLGFLNNKISSLEIGPNTGVKLYKLGLYLGKKKTFNAGNEMKSVKCLKDNKWDNKASSLKVWKRDVKPEPEPEEEKEEETGGTGGGGIGGGSGGGIGGGIGGGGDITYNKEKDCYNYEGKYRKGFKQCGYDKEHFRSDKSSQVDISDEVANIDDILEKMETNFETEGKNIKDAVQKEFLKKKKLYFDAEKMKKAYEKALFEREEAEDAYDAKRVKEEAAHAAYVIAVEKYNAQVKSYRAEHKSHLQRIDFLNYELFIIHQIREMFGPKLGKTNIVQSVIEYEPLKAKFEDFKYEFKTIKYSDFSNPKQRFQDVGDEM